MSALLRSPLTPSGEHHLAFHRAGASLQVALVRPATDRRDALHEALRVHLALEVNGAALRVEAPIELAASGRARVVVGDTTLALLDLETLTAAEGARTLTPFEVRVLADTGHPARARATGSATAARPLTDLHTHFAACVAPEELVALGLEVDAQYPAKLLAAAGIHVEATKPVALRSLDPMVRAHLQERLAIPIDRRITFLDLERVYALRAPITKHPDALVPMLTQLAKDYAAMGAEYVELSFANIVEARTLAAVHAQMPAIEARFGVTVRFLAALSRHDDLEWDLDLLDRIAELAGSKYLVGVDFMGHETNATRAFEAQLKAVAAWATRARPGFVVRVHAGENPAYPGNVREAVEAVANEVVELRIGHGVYGVDARTLDALIARDAIIEINASSNVALNNVIAFSQLALPRYAAAGARLVLGTDGYGIYGTTLALEATTALLSGLDEGALARIVDGERALIAKRTTRDEAAASDVYEVPPDAPNKHYTEAIARAARARRQARDEALEARLVAIAATRLEDAALASRVAGKRIVALAGSWTNHWSSLDDDARARLTSAIEALIAGLDPESHVVVTGGTRHGIEGVAGPFAVTRGLDVIAAIVAETPPESLERGAFTAAVIIAERLYDKAAHLYDWLRTKDAIALFFGGGPIVSDEIQAAKNLRLAHACFVGAGGASEVHGQADPRVAFASGEEALFRVASRDGRALGSLRYAGANEAADAVVLRRRATGLEVLLVRRDQDADAATGRWALPGGFVESDARANEAWRPGRESHREAMARELYEEAGIHLGARAIGAIEVGVYEGNGRDERDSESAFVRSTAFVLVLDDALADAPIAGGDDASDARWFSCADLPDLAFDHARIVLESLSLMRS